MTGIVLPAATLPRAELGFEERRRLRAQRRDGGALPFAIGAVTTGTGGKSPPAVTIVIEPAGSRIWIAVIREHGTGKAGIIPRYFLAARRSEFSGHLRHGIVTPPSGCVVVELTAEVSGIQSRQPGNEPAVTLTFPSVARETGAGASALAAAKGYDFTGSGELGFRNITAFSACGKCADAGRHQR